VEEALVEVELVPAHGDELGDAQAVAVGEEDGGGVAVAVAAAARAGGLDQPPDLLGGEVLARAHIGIPWPAWRNCRLFGGRGGTWGSCFGLVSHRPSIAHCRQKGRNRDSLW
jgi:hypothetical protein